MMNTPRSIALVLLSAGGCSGLLTAAAQTDLTTVDVTQQLIQAEHRLDGVVQAVNEATLTAEIPGRVSEVMFDVGDTVPADAVVIRLRGTEQKAEVSRAEAQVTYETFRDMGIAYAVGILLIYLLVVGQFSSYPTPLVIMAPIPLTIIGVLPGHALMGAKFTATSMIRMIALAGIIVRNSILLVDFINEQLRHGATLPEAVKLSGTVRAKPIVLTGIAAMMGAFFILDDPIFNGLAVSPIFGIFVSTALTLIVIPIIYYAINES